MQIIGFLAITRKQLTFREKMLSIKLSTNLVLIMFFFFFFRIYRIGTEIESTKSRYFFHEKKVSTMPS